MTAPRLSTLVLAELGLAGCVAYPAPGPYVPPPGPVYVAPAPPPAAYVAPAPRVHAPPRRRVWVPRQCDRWGRCWGGYWR